MPSPSKKKKKKGKGRGGGGGGGGAQRHQPDLATEETPEPELSEQEKELQRTLQMEVDLFDAAKRGCSASLERLIAEGVKLETMDQRGETAFHICCYKGHIDCVQTLLRGGCDINVLDAAGATGLMSSSNSGRMDVVKLLLDEGADMEIMSVHGHTAFILAYLNGHADAVRMLVRKGCDTTSKTKGMSGLMEAALGGRTTVVWAMLEAGMDMEETDKDGRTAFHWACAKGHTECAEALVTYGCDTAAKDRKGHTGMHLAMALGQGKTVDRLRELVALKLVEEKANEGKTITGENIDWSAKGYTAFHLACAGGEVEHVAAMIRAGVDTTCVTTTKDDFAGETGYDVAKRLKHTAVVKLLDDHQAEEAKRAKKEREARRKKEQKRRKKERERAAAAAAAGTDVSEAGAAAEPDPDDPVPEEDAQPQSPERPLTPASAPSPESEPEPEPEPEPTSDAVATTGVSIRTSEQIVDSSSGEAGGGAPVLSIEEADLDFEAFSESQRMKEGYDPEQAAAEQELAIAQLKINVSRADTGRAEQLPEEARAYAARLAAAASEVQTQIEKKYY